LLDVHVNPLQSHLDFIYNRNPFIKLLDMEIVLMGKGSATLSMPVVLGKHTNIYQIAHGGAIASLADTAMGFACGTLNHKVVTAEMNINLMRAAKPGGLIYAHAKVIHHGKRTLVVEAEVVNEEDKLLAKSRGTFFVVGQFLEGSDVDDCDQHPHT
jgi:1,4-dihydroxy-2-naphthoyl-CoA hydrolase